MKKGGGREDGRRGGGIKETKERIEEKTKQQKGRDSERKGKQTRGNYRKGKRR